jgi:predicted protein tyrosine phosphatase
MESYLFICSQGKNRSPFCARRFENLLISRGISANVSYAGIDPLAKIRPNPAQVYSAKLIFFMELEHIRQFTKEYTVMPKKMINLDIQDFYIVNNSNNGVFSEFTFESVLDSLVNTGRYQEVSRILEKEEIKQRLSLAEVFDRRNIMQYIRVKN